MSKHTPGPWRVGVCGSTAGRNFSLLAKKKNGWVNILKSNNFHDSSTRATTEEAEANARLIAAAPDLLEAAIQAEKVIDILWVSHHSNRTDAALDLLRAAIAKATGEQS